MMGQSPYPVSCYHVYGNGSLEALRRGMVLLAMVAVGFVICCLSIIFATSQLDFQNSVSLGESGVARPRPLGVTSFAWRRPTVSFRYDASGRCGKFNSICNLKRQRQILQAHGEKVLLWFIYNTKCTFKSFYQTIFLNCPRILVSFPRPPYST